MRLCLLSLLRWPQIHADTAILQSLCPELPSHGLARLPQALHQHRRKRGAVASFKLLAGPSCCVPLRLFTSYCASLPAISSSRRAHSFLRVLMLSRQRDGMNSMHGVPHLVSGAIIIRLYCPSRAQTHKRTRTRTHARQMPGSTGGVLRLSLPPGVALAASTIPAAGLTLNASADVCRGGAAASPRGLGDMGDMVPCAHHATPWATWAASGAFRDMGVQWDRAGHGPTVPAAVDPTPLAGAAAAARYAVGVTRRRRRDRPGA
jgi:hypothetical protein